LGLSHGLLVFDDTRSEWTRQGDRFQLRIFPNRFVYSREQNRASAPFLTVTLGLENREPPAAPTSLTSESRDLPPGEAIVSWVTPRDHGPAGTLGFMATLAGRPIPRELIPPGGPAWDARRDACVRPGFGASVVGRRGREGRGRRREPRAGGQHNGLVPGQARRIAAGIGPRDRPRASRDTVAPPGYR